MSPRPETILTMGNTVCVKQLVFGVISMGFFSSLFGCRDRREAAATNSSSEYKQADIYRDLRGRALALTSKDLKLLDGTDQPIAVLMETGYPEAVATLVAAADGSASLYFSNGGGIIGGGEHEPVRASVQSFLDLASGLRGQMEPSSSFPLPRLAYVRFYVVTPQGIWTTEALEDDLGNMRHALSPLFHKGHELITAIRENAPE